jgi:hypothetical protein
VKIAAIPGLNPEKADMKTEFCAKERAEPMKRR